MDRRGKSQNVFTKRSEIARTCARGHRWKYKYEERKAGGRGGGGGGAPCLLHSAAEKREQKREDHFSFIEAVR